MRPVGVTCWGHLAVINAAYASDHHPPSVRGYCRDLICLRGLRENRVSIPISTVAYAPECIDGEAQCKHTIQTNRARCCCCLRGRHDIQIQPNTTQTFATLIVVVISSGATGSHRHRTKPAPPCSPTWPRERRSYGHCHFAE